MPQNRLVVLAERPRGRPTAATFRIEEAPVPTPAAGQALVRNALMSVDPAMRGRMNDAKSYRPPYALGEPMEAYAVGTVVASRHPELPEGATVRHRLGWRDYALVHEAQVLDTTLAPASAYLGVLGVTGFAAYVGLVDVARLRGGETVFVSAAAGATGSLAGQIGRLLGATTIGSTGAEHNVRFLLDELRYDRAFWARDGAIREELDRAAPDGIDVYFDNVGGETLDAAFRALRSKGRIAACGMIAGYNARVPGPSNIFMMMSKQLRMEGFLVSSYVASYPAFLKLVAPALRDGRIVAPETIVDGLENAPAALISLFDRGVKRGKLLVRIDEGSDASS
jgi:NADPH-dependent curcumin reductase CurA